jgi:hypothetical protein
MVIKVNVNPITINDLFEVWNQLTAPNVKKRAPNEPIKGQGLTCTK